MLATVLGVAAWPATASRNATLLHPAVLPDSECVGFVGGQEATGGSAPTTAATTAPVLLDGLGYAGLEPDSANAEARAWFAQGVRLIWAFDEVEAIRAFQQAQRARSRIARSASSARPGRAGRRSICSRATTSWSPPAPPRSGRWRSPATSATRPRARRRRWRSAPAPGDAFSNDDLCRRIMEAQALRHPDDDTIAIMAADARMVTFRDSQPQAGDAGPAIAGAGAGAQSEPWRRHPLLYPPDRLDRPGRNLPCLMPSGWADRAGGEPSRPYAVAHLLRRSGAIRMRRG